MKTVILTSCNNSVEAKLIQGNLANEGIESIVSNDNYTSLYPNTNTAFGSGVKIFVYESDVEKAMKIIQGDDWKTHCPQCDSVNVDFLKLNFGNNVKKFLNSVITFIPFENSKSKFHCNDCGKDFEM